MPVRPAELLYAVDDRLPPQRLAGLGLQYAVLISIYLIFVVMVARAAGAPDDVTQDLVGLGFIAVAARSLSTRACFALSIGLLLGLATQVHTEFFQTLPGPWDDIFGNMLTISLATAIGLTLIFRIGIRQKDATVWRASDALAAFGPFLDKEARAWKLPPELVERVKEGVTDVVTHIRDGHFIDAPLEIAASYDGLDLLVDLKYRGRPPSFGESERGHERVHEEAAVTAGLKSFGASAHADRSSISTDGDKVSVKLWFSA